MDDYIVGIVLRMKPPVDIKYDPEKKIKMETSKGYRPYKTRNVRTNKKL